MKVVEPGNHRISNLFDNFCHKLGHDFLLLEEFLSFYEAQTKKRQEAVRHNLGEFNIGRDLKSKLETQTLTYESDPRTVRNGFELPRAKIAQDDNRFERLLDLVATSGTEDVHRTVFDDTVGLWQLIMQLQTNKTLLNRVLNLEDLDGLLCLHEDQMQSANTYKILYIIQIIKSLIDEYAAAKESFVILTVDKLEADR